MTPWEEKIQVSVPRPKRMPTTATIPRMTRRTMSPMLRYQLYIQEKVRHHRRMKRRRRRRTPTATPGTWEEAASSLRRRLSTKGGNYGGFMSSTIIKPIPVLVNIPIDRPWSCPWIRPMLKTIEYFIFNGFLLETMNSTTWTYARR
jgi:hypothetical protein